VAQRVGRGIALLFHDCGTRRGWVVSSRLQLHFTPGKDPVPILQEAGWAPGPVSTGGKYRLHWDSILDCPARSHSLYPLSYSAHISHYTWVVQRQLNNQTTSTQHLTLYLQTWRILWAPNNASKGQMGFNLAFKGLKSCSLKFKYSQSIFNLLSQKHLFMFFEITIVSYCYKS